MSVCVCVSRGDVRCSPVILLQLRVRARAGWTSSIVRVVIRQAEARGRFAPLRPFLFALPIREPCEQPAFPTALDCNPLTTADFKPLQSILFDSETHSRTDTDPESVRAHTVFRILWRNSDITTTTTKLFQNKHIYCENALF